MVFYECKDRLSPHTQAPAVSGYRCQFRVWYGTLSAASSSEGVAWKAIPVPPNQALVVFLNANARNWMNLRDADSGKVLWQGTDDL